jgi:hypothetical protein
MLRVKRNDDTPVKTRSSSMSDLPKKVISPERALVLPSATDADKYEAICVQLEMVRLNGACTFYLIQSLVTTVNKLSDDVTQLKSDNLALKLQVQDLQGLVVELTKVSKQQPQGSSFLRPALRKEVVDSWNLAPQQNSTRSYAEVANFVSAMQAVNTLLRSADDGSMAASGMYKQDCPVNKASSEDSEGQADSDGFKIVTYKKQSTQATSAATTVNQHRQPLIGVRNFPSLPIVSKKERSKALFVSRFSPEVTTVDV